MEEHRSEKLLDQIRACPEPGERMPSASHAVAHRCKHYSYCKEQTWTAWIKRRIGSRLQPSEQDGRSVGTQTYWVAQDTLRRCCMITRN